MKINDLRSKSLEELYQNLAELKFNLLNLRIQNRSGNLQDGSQIRHTRRAIAQVLTVINEKKGEITNG